MRLTRTNISMLLVAALVIGAAVTAFMMISAPSAAQVAAAALEESSDEVRSNLSDDLSPDRPLVIMTDIFRRGGFKTADADDWTLMEIYGEQVTRKLVITPDASGMAVGITDDVANLDGSPHIVENLMDGTRTVAPVGNTGADDGGEPADSGLLDDTDGEPGPTGNTGIEEPWKIATWLDAKLVLHQNDHQQGIRVRRQVRARRPTQHPLRVPRDPGGASQRPGVRPAHRVRGDHGVRRGEPAAAPGEPLHRTG